MPGSIELMTAAWRVILGTSGGGASASAAAASSSLATAATDLAAGRRILEQIQLALAQAFRKRGAHALSSAEIAPIKALCDELLPTHFQLRVPEAQQDASASPKSRRVRYQHIWEDERVSMGIFILPPGASIPLHDHPEMSVISRVLYGSLHVRSCDLLPAADTTGLSGLTDRVTAPSAAAVSAAPLEARVCADEEIYAPHTTELLPDRGNLHEFVAGDALGCAIFDILTPPYEPDDGRDCTYYRVLGAWPSAVDDTADSFHPPVVALEVFDPEHFAVVSEPYLGPALAALPSTASLAVSPSASATSSNSESSSHAALLSSP